MRRLFRIAFTVVLIVVGPASRGAEILSFRRFGSSSAHARLQSFMNTGDRSLLAEFDLSGLNDLRVVLSTALGPLADPKAPPELVSRAKAILRLRVRLDLVPTFDANLVARAKDLAGRLLDRLPATDSTRAALMLNIEKFELWSGRQAAYLIEHVSYDEGLRSFHDVLVRVAPEFSERELDELELALRARESLGKLPGHLLFEIGRLQEADVIALLGLASTEYASAISSHEQATLIRHYEEWLSLDNQAFARLLLDVKHAISNGDVEMSKAFRHARRAALETGSKARLSFFSAFQEDLFDWLDREAWLRPRTLLEPRTEESAEIIRGPFGAATDCSKNFEK